MLKLQDSRNELFQWDTDRKLIVDGECSEVHFSNKILGSSVDISVVDGVVKIPDELLQTNRDLNVWAYVGNTESGYTKAFRVFKVIRRPKPSDYVYTPSEIQSLKTLAERVKLLEESGGVTDEQIKNAVDDYLEENPIESNAVTEEELFNYHDVENLLEDTVYLYGYQALVQPTGEIIIQGCDGRGIFSMPAPDGLKKFFVSDESGTPLYIIFGGGNDGKTSFGTFALSGNYNETSVQIPENTTRIYITASVESENRPTVVVSAKPTYTIKENYIPLNIDGLVTADDVTQAITDYDARFDLNGKFADFMLEYGHNLYADDLDGFLAIANDYFSRTENAVTQEEFDAVKNDVTALGNDLETVESQIGDINSVLATLVDGGISE